MYVLAKNSVCAWLFCGLFLLAPRVYAHKESPEAAVSIIKDRLACIESRIPLHHNRFVQSFIKYFTEHNRSYTELVLSRQSRYFPIFEHYLAKYGLPDELKYLAVVESGLDPKAISKAGAAGLWQFMPSTGRAYQLFQTKYIDDRFDPNKATDAACRHLRDLYKRFGDWELVLAAFNSGSGRVSRAMRRSGRRSFWQLYRYLPRETRSYLPQFVSIMYVMNYHYYHGIFAQNFRFLPHTDTLHIRQGIDLKLFATAINLCKNDLIQLNPSYLWGIAPPGRRSILYLPHHMKDTLTPSYKGLLSELALASKPAIKALEKKLKKRRKSKKRLRYRVRRGDALITIARRHKVRIADIFRWNRLRNTRIYAGQYLTLWVRPYVFKKYVNRRKKPSKKALRARKRPKNTIYYIVKSGDTLWDISRSSSTSIRAIKSLNNLRSNRIRPGQTLLLPRK